MRLRRPGSSVLEAINQCNRHQYFQVLPTSTRPQVDVQLKFSKVNNRLVTHDVKSSNQILSNFIQGPSLLVKCTTPLELENGTGICRVVYLRGTVVGRVLW